MSEEDVQILALSWHKPSRETVVCQHPESKLGPNPECLVFSETGQLGVVRDGLG